MYFKNQKFCVFGLSSSGRCAAEKLLSLGATVYIYDEDSSARLTRTAEDLSKNGAIVVTSDIGEVLGIVDVIVLSPGVRIDHPLLVQAKRNKKRIIGELELGSYFMKAPMVAVTGTNGKTTTCTLVFEALKAAGVESAALGNYGVPLTINGEKLSSNGVAVVEVSSFQLETVRSFCPHIAVILNVTSDHLDRHYTRENYVYLKSRLLTNLRESEYAVLNFDDTTVRSFGAGLKTNVIWFSETEKVSGAYVKEGYFYWFDERLFSVDTLPLKGEHNVENALAAICVLKTLNIDNEVIARSFSEFKGVKHRIELVLSKNGVDYYNDSKSTNVSSTIVAIDAMKKPTVLILGGKDKDQDYAPLFEKIKHSLVRHAVLTGEERYKLLAAANAAGFIGVTVSPGFESAVKIAKIEARGEGAVLLSPATSSFDAFSNYEERGEEFARIVREIS
ncbi:MAG: UDP-N-acetylmuramoyl-L-alanine--D-glutamate ligase [Clostridia bacterium]|nr:UDP-N-acetylmuramoyl-L-alanine--D-glutamate ligase [Clostridia bacterium]